VLRTSSRRVFLKIRHCVTRPSEQSSLTHCQTSISRFRRSSHSDTIIACRAVAIWEAGLMRYASANRARHMEIWLTGSLNRDSNDD